MRKPYPCLAVLLPLLCIGAALIYYLPTVRASVFGGVGRGWERVKVALAPPSGNIPTPQTTTVLPFPLTPLATITPSPTIPAAPTEANVTPSPTLPPTLTPTPPPALARLSGIVYMAQMYNNVGPANLAMALSFWGWEGDQRVPAALLKPNVRDRNVMPYELAAYVEEQTDFGALVRVNGDLMLLKRFIAAGFPLLIEKGLEGGDIDGWMGHYLVISGYDDAYQHVIVQDSRRGANLTLSYAQLMQDWRAFNYTYLVIYPTARGEEVVAILGPHLDATYNYQAAADRAAAEVKTSQGRDLYFAWFNRGSSLTGMQDYANAAVAFDAAFANYTAIPERQRPWRMLWYQTSPYFAYFYSQRFQDVINLADQTLQNMSEPVLEESYYWRAKAEAALGNVEAAIADYRRALTAHPGFTPAIDELRYLGEDPDA